MFTVTGINIGNGEKPQQKTRWNPHEVRRFDPKHASSRRGGKGSRYLTETGRRSGEKDCEEIELPASEQPDTPVSRKRITAWATGGLTAVLWIPWAYLSPSNSF